MIDLITLAILIIIGLVIIVALKLFIVLIPAAIVAIIVWFITNNHLYTGIAFVLVAALSLAKKL